MNAFLRILSAFYLIGTGVHFLDLMDLRLKFSELPLFWKVWTIYLFMADAAATIGLWKRKSWGIVLFLAIACSQLIAYLGFSHYFGDQRILLAFHTISISTWLVLALRSKAAN